MGASPRLIWLLSLALAVSCGDDEAAPRDASQGVSEKACPWDGDAGAYGEPCETRCWTCPGIAISGSVDRSKCTAVPCMDAGGR